MQTQFGKYTLLQKLGDGGMSEVFLAQNQGLEGFTKLVALKRMLPHLNNDVLFTQSFINEARLGGYLNHHNIVQTLEFGQVDDHYYLAMEYVRGVSLAEVLTAQIALGRPMPVELALQLGLQIAEGLNYAHTAEDSEGRPLRMVHRDMKPSNILINNFGVCKIADFGVARAESNVAQTVMAGDVKGTVTYMSPEQAMGSRNLDGRSDLYSLGAILFELLAGERLYPSESYLQVLRQVQDGDIADRLPRILQLEQGPRLHHILSRTLAYDPDERYDSAADLGREMREVLANFDLEQQLADYLKALLPNTAMTQRGTMLNLPVAPPSTASLTASSTGNVRSSDPGAMASRTPAAPPPRASTPPGYAAQLLQDDTHDVLMTQLFTPGPPAAQSSNPIRPTPPATPGRTARFQVIFRTT